MDELSELIENPKLVAAMQAVKKGDNRVTQAKVMEALLEAQLLIPISVEVLEEKDENGNERLIHFKMIQNTAKQSYFLAFSDLTELKKWKDEPDRRCAVMTFDDYAALVLDTGSDAEGIALDPFGSNLIMTKDIVRTLRREKRIQMGGGIDLSAVYPKIYK